VRQSKVHGSLHGSGMWIGITLLVFGGCVSLNSRTIYPEKHYYALEVTRPGEPHVPVFQTILKVRKFRISPSFAGKQFVSRTSEARYETDFYHEWFVLPNAMLTQQVLNWQTRAGLFQYVMDSSGSLQATHTLEGNVTALFGDDRGTPSKAVLGLQFFLLSEAPHPENVMWHREYREEVDLPEQSSPEALVKGWNEALRRILSALEEDLIPKVSPQ
jgi:cholesterol transport system auxiliary component